MRCPTGTLEVNVVRVLPPSDRGRLGRPTRQVETMVSADSLQLTAYGPDEDEIGVVEGAAAD